MRERHRDASTLADVELSVARMRWIAVIAVPLVLWLYRPPAGVEFAVPEPVYGGIAVTGLVLANVVTFLAIRTGDVRRVHLSALLGTTIDLGLALLLIFVFGVDTTSRFWPIVTIVVIEAASRWRLLGSLTVAAVGMIGYATEQVIHLPLKETPGSWVSGVAFATAITFIIAVGTGTLSARSRYHRDRADRQTERLLSLAQLTRAITSQRHPQAVLDRLLEAFTTLSEFETAAFYERVRADEWIRRASRNLRGATTGEVETVPHFTAMVDALDRPTLLDLDETLARRRDRISPDSRSVVAVPIVHEDVTIGLVFLGTSEWVTELSPEISHLLELLASQATVAIESARLLEAEQRTVTELRSLDRMRDDFVTILSHELRSPLTSIEGYAHLLRGRWTQLDDEQRQSFLDRIARNSDRLGKLVQDILDTAQAEREQLPMHLRAVDVEPIAREVAELELATATEHQLTIRVEPPIPAVHADPDRVRQILHNLLSNAVKYSPRGGRITVDLRRETGWVAVSVSDDGLGIDAGELDRVFDKFSRLDSGREVKGTGLGLYLSRQLARAMDGDITVRSTPGSGSEFTLRLPQASRRAPTVHTARTPTVQEPTP